MYYIHGLPICPPICPPLVHEELISASDESLHHQSNILMNQKLSTYAKQIGRHFVFPFTRKENLNNDTDTDEEFDQISLPDNYSVSVLENKIYRDI